MLVDILEPVEIFQGLAKLLGDKVERKPLPTGDYWIESPNGLVIIERKEVGDLIGSVLTGHLSHQVRDMLSMGKILVLLIEGWITCTVSGDLRTSGGIRHLSWNFLWNYLLTVQSHGVLLDFSPNRYFTVKRLFSIYQYWNRTEHQSLRVLEIPRVGSTPQIAILSQFPGISTTLAERLLVKFGTLRTVFQAKWQERCEVDGIGKTKSIGIDEVLDGKGTVNSEAIPRRVDIEGNSKTVRNNPSASPPDS